jgi:crotonobetainyl-CoA:carnitine CoA-transferase CaiB-like acyl-CoA transferase
MSTVNALESKLKKLERKDKKNRPVEHQSVVFFWEDLNKVKCAPGYGHLLVPGTATPEEWEKMAEEARLEDIEYEKKYAELEKEWNREEFNRNSG